MFAEPPLSSTPKTPPSRASLRNGGSNDVGITLALHGDVRGAQRAGGLMSAPVCSSASNATASTDLLSAAQQLSNDVGNVSSDAAERARKLQPHPQRVAAW